MIDLKALRADPEPARRGLRDRGGRHLGPFEELLALDRRHRESLTAAEEMRSRRNALSQEVGRAKAAKDEAKAEALRREVVGLKEELARREAELGTLAEAARQAALGLPNIPHDSVPRGAGPDENPVVRRGPEPRAPGFKPLDHQTAGERLGILDFAAAAKLSGSRFALWKGAGARLMRALGQFMLDLHGRKGYAEILPPCLVKPEILVGTGQLPKFGADLYKTKSGEGDQAEDLYLIPTAEVPLTNLVREDILAAEMLPIKLMALTPCFRQEAGSYGKDVRGLIRNHQFDKVELVWITRPQDSLAALDQLTRDAEAVLEALEIPHRVVELCAGDLGFAARKTNDLEVWMAAEGRYREISSCSDCGDFQARRMNARFRPEPNAAPELVHTLNGSGVAVGRLFAAALENWQRRDGGIDIPPALRPYFGSDRIPAPT